MQHEIPDYILEKLRAREGLEKYDSSLDADIKLRSPMFNFSEVVGWELGDERWADQIVEWMRGCGIKVDSGKEQS